MTALPPIFGPEEALHGPAMLAELDNAIRGPAVQGAIEARIAQIFRDGHDRASDRRHAPEQLARLAHGRLLRAIDQIGPGRCHNPEIGRANLLRSAAMLLAAVDRLDQQAEPPADRQRSAHDGGAG